ncbi:hypothetical protein MTO96_012320 [Rhipicephalus appendiculatus]
MASFECIFTSDGAGQLWNTCVWDVVSASVLSQYKGGTSSPRTLCLLGSDYVISAQHDKPLLRVWSLQRRDQIQRQIVCPGRVSALAASPDGLHCVAGIEDKIYLWQVSSGDLLAVRHVTARCWSGTWLRLPAPARGDLPSPCMRGRSTAMMLQTSTFGALGGTRCYTCSADQTCRVFDIDSGGLLATVVLDAALTAVVTDPAEDHIFAGSSTGKIFEVALYKWNTGNKRPEATFLGHEGKVTCLATSLDGQLLVSGSEDCTARVWDVASKQCIHVLHHKGACHQCAGHANARDPDVHAAVATNTSAGCLQAHHAGGQGPERSTRASGIWPGEHEPAHGEVDGDEDEGSTFEDEEDLSKQVAMLKEVNKQLYSYAWNCVLRQQQTTGSDMSSM